MTELRQVVNRITGKNPQTLLQIKAELLSFLRENEAEDLIVDPDDMELLLEMCAIYSDEPIEDVLVDSVVKQIHQKPIYNRVGKRLLPLTYKKDRLVFEKFARAIENLHPDIRWTIRQRGVVFLDDVGPILAFRDLRSIENAPSEFSGILRLYRIYTKEDLKQAIPEPYLSDKEWKKDTAASAKRVNSGYITMSEVLDLLTNRTIITYGNYE